MILSRKKSSKKNSDKSYRTHQTERCTISMSFHTKVNPTHTLTLVNYYTCHYILCQEIPNKEEYNFLWTISMFINPSFSSGDGMVSLSTVRLKMMV